jgi:hypothetical protein
MRTISEGGSSNVRLTFPVPYDFSVHFLKPMDGIVIAIFIFIVLFEICLGYKVLWYA